MNNVELLEKFVLHGAFSLDKDQLNTLCEAMDFKGDDTLELLDIVNENKIDLPSFRKQIRQIAQNYRPLEQLSASEIAALAFSGNCPPAIEGSEYADLSQNELGKLIFK